MAKIKKKRKATRIFEDDPEGEALLPARKTKEIAETYEKNKPVENNNIPVYLRNTESNLDEKELFDFMVKRMASPDKK